jgi:hypothetical protein
LSPSISRGLRFCLFCSPHGNDKVIETHEHAGDFKERNAA